MDLSLSSRSFFLTFDYKRFRTDRVNQNYSLFIVSLSSLLAVFVRLISLFGIRPLFCGLVFLFLGRMSLFVGFVSFKSKLLIKIPDFFKKAHVM